MSAINWTKEQLARFAKLGDRHIFATDCEQGDDVFPNLTTAGETWNSDPKRRNGCLNDIGFAVMHLGSGETKRKWRKPMPFCKKDMGERCKQGFWENEAGNPGIGEYLKELLLDSNTQIWDTHHKLSDNPAAHPPDSYTLQLAIKKACIEVAEWFDQMDLDFDGPWAVSDNCEYDGGMLNVVLALAGRPHLSYIYKGLDDKGEKRYEFGRVMIHTDSFCRAICSDSMLDMWGQDGRALKRYGLKMPAEIVHNHRPDNDAESIAWTLHAVFKKHFEHLERIEPLLDFNTGTLPASMTHILKNLVMSQARIGVQLELEAPEFEGLGEKGVDYCYAAAVNSHRTEYIAKMTEEFMEHVRDFIGGVTFDAEKIAREIIAKQNKREAVSMQTTSDEERDGPALLDTAPEYDSGSDSDEDATGNFKITNVNCAVGCAIGGNVVINMALNDE